jgi:hypothetical protein
MPRGAAKDLYFRIHRPRFAGILLSMSKARKSRNLRDF